ncbi:MAG: hypothetical protein HY319_23355 [Armatimonadetes bacterium]|nr:hypothetical protein [Armatimonadota bacterium]
MRVETRNNQTSNQDRVELSTEAQQRLEEDELARASRNGSSNSALSSQPNGNGSTPPPPVPQPHPTPVSDENTRRSDQLIASNTTWYGNLDEDQVGRTLAQSRDHALTNRTLDRLDWQDRDDVSYAAASSMDDNQLREMAQTPQGRQTLRRLSQEMNGGVVTDDESRQIQRMAALTNPEHARMLDDTVSPDVQRSLEANNLTQQRIQDGGGTLNMDEYSVTVDRMPPGVTPEQFLDRMARNPNAVANNGTFDTMATFERRGDPNRDPRPGDVYDINMGNPWGGEGLDNGTVILRDRRPDRFTLSTVTDNNFTGEGEHPIYGNREFGYRTNEDGSVTFYTRAADRRTDGYGNIPGVNTGVEYGQDRTWRNFVQGVGDEINREGGQTRPNSITAQSWRAGEN